MTKEQILKKFIEKHVPDFESSNNGLEALKQLSTAINNQVSAYEEINDILTNRGLGDIWVSCPDCVSPVLLNYKECNVCDRELISSDDVVEEKPKKTSKKKASKKVEKKVIVADFDESEDDVVEEKPKKTSKKKASKKKASKKVEKKLIVVDVDESEDELEDDGEPNYPSEDKVNAMSSSELKKLVVSEKLDVDVKKYKRGDLDDFREAVNDAIDYEIDKANDDENAEDIVDSVPEDSKTENTEDESNEDEDEDDDDFDFDFDDDE